VQLQVLDSGSGEKILQENDLETALAAIRRDWSLLAARIHTIEHDVTTDHKLLTLRLHYPALRGVEATVGELVKTIALFLAHFSLPRKQVQAAYDDIQAKTSQVDQHLIYTQLDSEARSLFMRARKTAARTGEAGELLLYLLTEWLLEAPQIIAKMSLKTNAQMPVHGSDGVHIRFDADTANLVIYSGEAKLHSDVGSAIRSAVESIQAGASREKMDHELALVRRHLDLSSLNPAAQKSLLAYLDPFEPVSNKRQEVVTCLLGFDFADYTTLDVAGDDPDGQFQALAIEKLRMIGPAFANALAEAELPHQKVELFLFPVPSVTALRDQFQNQIGWARD
jgi:hypothetical protein